MRACTKPKIILLLNQSWVDLLPHKYEFNLLMRGIFFLLSVVIASQVFSQNLPGEKLPKGYFRKPLDIPASLAGNFGELRPNHYHMGLDFKTNRVENLPVHAAADGHVARIKIEPFGFGRAIYIDHPNGYTTVYAHLNSFFPALEAYVKEQQYKQESWSIYLEIPAWLFPVKKGDVIAHSGNTGGSQGPHLHFEIRQSATDVNLNPMLFGMDIPDKTAPAILRLAIYDRNKSTYEQSPVMMPVKKTAKGYMVSAAPVVVHTDKVSFAMTSYDTQSGSANQNGIYEGVLYDNDTEMARFAMKAISYEYTRYINAHIDYKTKAGNGPYLQHLSELPGYVNSIYTKGKSSGVVDLSDREVHHIRIVSKDAYGNASEVKFAVKYVPKGGQPATAKGKMFYPLMVNVGEGSEDCDYYIGEKGLYDSVHIPYSRQASNNPVVVSAVHSIGAAYIPVQEGLVVRIKPVYPLTPEAKNRVVMQRFAGSKKEVVKVEWQGEYAMARFRELGNFQLVLDETPPEIVPVGFKDSSDVSKTAQLVFTVKDNLDQFRRFRAELDGKWLCFSNNKGRYFVYAFDEQCVPGTHHLKISVSDEAGNIATRVFTFTR